MPQDKPDLLPDHVRNFLLTFDVDLQGFDEGCGWERPAQDAERLGLGFLSAWKGGWQFRLSDKGISHLQSLEQRVKS